MADADLLSQRLIVCVGAGGVGKTTTAAALAIAAARRGRPTAVITVDPSRRLKDALGLEQIGGEAKRVELGDGCAPLDALALDTKRTFDRLIARAAPTPAVAERIFANRLYQELSSEIGGSAEYMAMEKLHELLQQERYELIVVDTPPSADLRALLTAPLRMVELLASHAVEVLKAPASVAARQESRLLRLTVGTLLRALERWTGLAILYELSEFVAGFEALVDGFRSRAQAIDTELRAADTRFVIVATAEPNTVDTTLAFDRELRAGGYPVAGIIANRVHDFPPLAEAEVAAEGIEEMSPALRRKLLANYADFAALGERDRAALDALRTRTGVPLVAVLPALEEPPVSLDAMCRVAAFFNRGDAGR